MVTDLRSTFGCRQRGGVPDERLLYSRHPFGRPIPLLQSEDSDPAQLLARRSQGQIDKVRCLGAARYRHQIDTLLPKRPV